MAASFWLCCDRVPGEARSRRFIHPRIATFASPNVRELPLKESSELRESTFPDFLTFICHIFLL